MIYFILSESRIKIGYSATPWRRFASFQTANPARLEMLAVAEGGKALEIALHRQFAALRIPRSEWFHDDERIRAVAGAMSAAHPELQQRPNGDNKPLPFSAAEKSLPVEPQGHDTSICPQCRQEFDGRGSQLYCSGKCKRSAANRRQYERKLQQQRSIAIPDHNFEIGVLCGNETIIFPLTTAGQPLPGTSLILAGDVAGELTRLINAHTNEELRILLGLHPMALRALRLHLGIAAQTPYHPDLPKKFRALGGQWHDGAKVWTFDARDEDRVRAVVEEIFGSLEKSGQLVTVRWTVDARYNPARLAGRIIAERRGRDSYVSLAPGVVVIAGEFPSSGGSRNNPSLGIGTGSNVIVEIRDVDANIAARMVEEGAEIVG